MAVSSYRYSFSEIETSVRGLIANGLSDSADKLCNLVLATSGGLPPEDQHLMLELHGDSIFANKEYRRALQLYRQASQPSTTPGTPSHDSGSCNIRIRTARQAKLRLKECQCHILLEDPTIALRELEAIPVELRDVAANVCLGRLYKNAGLRRHAVTTVCTQHNQYPGLLKNRKKLLHVSLLSSSFTLLYVMVHHTHIYYVLIHSCSWCWPRVPWPSSAWRCWPSWACRRGSWASRRTQGGGRTSCRS
jgi:hypothetical protein